MLRCQNELTGLSFTQASLLRRRLINPPTVSLFLKSRKNLPLGARLVRKCMCPARTAICPVHIVSRYLSVSGRKPAGKLFPFSYASFGNVLRAHLAQLNVPDAHTFTTKAFRRGTAQQMVKSRSSLGQILTAGQWSSAAFMTYLQLSEVNEEAVFELLDELSDDDNERTQNRRR